MGVHSHGRAVGRYWVVIETGANQAYIFGSNKQVVNVGASELIRRVGTDWIKDAISEVAGDLQHNRQIEPVICASGKALLLADDREIGKSVIRAVTRRALDEAPGLQVWGVVDHHPISSDEDVGAALKRVHSLHAAWRSWLPSIHLRNPTLPFVRLCPYSGRPATAERWDGEMRRPLAAAIDAAWEASRLGRARMEQLLGEERARTLPRKLIDGVTNAGWVAVMHADGNGIGQIFQKLADEYVGQEFLDRLQSFSSALNRITEEALRRAVETAGDQEGWILPLIVGGDDVTVLMDGRRAFDATVTFLREFGRLSREDGDIRDVVRATIGQSGLTASAGLVYVKPHYSFSDAYALTEELCASAKSIKRMNKEWNTDYGALDFHIFHGSVGHTIDEVREPLRVTGPDGRPMQLWCGPVVVGDDQPPASNVPERHVNRLHDAMAGLRGGVISRRGLHRIRAALLQGGVEIERARHQVAAWAGDRDAEAVAKAIDYLDCHVQVNDQHGDVFSRILSAAELLDMETGTVPYRTLTVAAGGGR